MDKKKGLSSSKKSNNKAKNPLYLRGLAFIIKELGIPGTVLYLISYLFFTHSTDEQKTKFINKFILLDDSASDLIPVGLIIVVLVIVNIIQYSYYRLKLKLYKTELDRIGNEKTTLQELLLKSKLNTSNTKNL